MKIPYEDLRDKGAVWDYFDINSVDDVIPMEITFDRTYIVGDFRFGLQYFIRTPDDSSDVTTHFMIKRVSPTCYELSLRPESNLVDSLPATFTFIAIDRSNNV